MKMTITRAPCSVRRKKGLALLGPMLTVSPLAGSGCRNMRRHAKRVA